MSKNDYPAYIDRRDEAVVSRMTKGDTYGRNQLERAYKAYTDIQNDSTAAQRAVNLFESPCMEYTGTPGSFRFVGTEEPEDIL